MINPCSRCIARLDDTPVTPKGRLECARLVVICLQRYRDTFWTHARYETRWDSLPLGVCVLTTNDSDRGAIGMTVNSFAAVSLEPALVLWSIQNTSECFKEFTECDRYGISVLRQSQEAISNRYARSLEHTVDAGDCFVDSHGVPLIEGALATFSCQISGIHPGGDHHIIVGEVIDFTSPLG
jgi:flavin reductase (DIM6/NTAB) family NADH-FMN oxidoreductase RutF